MVRGGMPPNHPHLERQNKPRSKAWATRQCSHLASQILRSGYSERCCRHAGKSRVNHSRKRGRTTPSHPQNWSLDRSLTFQHEQQRSHHTVNCSPANPLPTNVTGEAPAHAMDCAKAEKQRFPQGTAVAVSPSSAGRPGRNVTVTFFARMKPSRP